MQFYLCKIQKFIQFKMCSTTFNKLKKWTVYLFDGNKIMETTHGPISLPWLQRWGLPHGTKTRWQCFHLLIPSAYTYFSLTESSFVARSHLWAYLVNSHSDGSVFICSCHLYTSCRAHGVLDQCAASIYVVWRVCQVVSTSLHHFLSCTLCVWYIVACYV